MQTRGAVRALRGTTRSMVRPQESGQTPRAFSSAPVAATPIKRYAGGRRGIGLTQAADGEHGPFRFGWDR
jgi:hypothetical protein